MKLCSFLFLLFCSYGYCSVLSNVRLVDHTSYALEVIESTVHTIEDRGWSTMKLPDYVQHMNESILNTPVSGTVTYTNGFLVSIEHLDLLQSTVQQVWFHNTTTQITTVSVTGTLRMHQLVVGYDVIAELDGDTYYYTTTYTHPLVSFAFSIIKDPNVDSLDVTVDGTVPRTTHLPAFKPTDETSDLLSSMFDPTLITSDGIIAWGPEVFRPITYELVTKEIAYPTFCYNCAA